MKNFFMMILLSANVLGSSNDPIISLEKGSGEINVHGLRCTVFAGHNINEDLRDRLFTVLGDSQINSRPLSLMRPTGVSITLKHHFAQANGCPIEELDLKVNESRVRFGFVDAKLTLSKKSSGPFLNGLRKCVERYREELEIEISPSIKLKSHKSEIREVVGC